MRFRWLGAVCFTLLGASVFADSIILNAIDTGCVASGGGFDPNSYVTGIQLSWGSETRGFYAFDLTQIPAGSTITAATISVQNPYSYNEVGPGNPLPLHVYYLKFANPFNMGAGFANGNFGYIGGIYTPEHATKNIMPSDSGTTVKLPINVTGIASLNAERTNATAYFGMKITKVDSEIPKPLQYVFNGTALGGTVQLEVEYSPVATQSVVVGQIFLQDWPQAQSAQRATFNIIQNGSVVETKQINLQYGGLFSFLSGVSGACEITAKVSHWLAKSSGPVNLTLGENTEFTAELINGDIDNNNEVGPSDFSRLAIAFGTTDGDDLWSPSADLDGDGEIGPGDFGILAASFGNSGD